MSKTKKGFILLPIHESQSVNRSATFVKLGNIINKKGCMFFNLLSLEHSVSKKTIGVYLRKSIPLALECDFILTIDEITEYSDYPYILKLCDRTNIPLYTISQFMELDHSKL